ncbi:MAG: aldehyde dehydrogenase family protein [Thaumarchaeota archaeon]|nr:aldehyde dehydrogenase family protein [Candidatus Terraquivivens yellowstonensis]
MSVAGPRLEYGAPKLKLGKFFDEIYEVGPDGIPVFKMFLDGKWVSASTNETFDIDTPIDDSVIARAQKAGEKDMELAIDVAKENQGRIRDIAAISRIEIFHLAVELMKERTQDFVETLMLEAGKPRRDALGEVKATIDRMRLTMEEARKIFGEYIPGDWSEDTVGKIALVIHEPVGVVGAIGPFNYPLYIPAAKIIPALLSGNSVVVKPASDDPLSQLLFARILEEAGLPRGCLNVVTGPGKIASLLASSEKVRLVSFTGSTSTGKELYKASTIKPMHLELGGKALAIVLDDADLDLAAKKCVEGSLRNAGQRCDAISVVLVQKSVADVFVEKVLKEVDGWKFGDPRDPDVMMGPMINRRAVEYVYGLVKDALDKGAKLLRGGRYWGCYFEPTVLDNVPLDAKIVWEETFGPVIPIVRIDSEDDAIEISRRSRYGLDSCVFTNNFYRMWKVAKRLQVGEVTINDMPRHGVGFFPFGGVKDSGIGREGIGYSIDEMTVLKTIVFNLEPAGLGKVKKAL